jgi:hypothetical protein
MPTRRHAALSYDEEIDVDDYMVSLRQRQQEKCPSLYEPEDEETGGCICASKQIQDPYDEKWKGENLVRNSAFILAMERTFFAALNNSWLLVIGGIGLMSVGDEEGRGTNVGIFVLASGIATAAVAYIVHIGRVAEIRKNRAFRYSETVMWATLVIALTVVSLGFELYFGIRYPYLERRFAVTTYNSTAP